MRTLNTKYTSEEMLKEFIAENQIASHESILLQVFTGHCDKTFIKGLVSLLTDLIPHIKIIGSTTSGEIYFDEVRELETVLSFSLFKETQVETFYTQCDGDSYVVGQKLINQFDTTKNPKVAIAFTDGIEFNGEQFLSAFTDFDDTLTVAGGLAGDNAMFIETIVFTEKEILTKGAVVALLHNENLVVNTGASFGWQSIGKTLRVTKAEGNVVYEIDGMSPVNLYAKYLGADITAELPKTGIEFPLIIHRNDLHIPRAVIGRNDDGSLIFAGNLSTGDKVKFGYGNIDAIVHGGQIVYNKMSEVACESVFVYSCMARKALMGPSIATELKLLTSLAPLCGFFTYGEFYSNKKASNSELLNQTMTILSLSEKEDITHEKQNSLAEHEVISQNLTSKALSHLIAQTSLELEQMNSMLENRVKWEIEKNRNKDQQLLEQSRMAQMGEMISMIAHQWRQPLSAISAASIDLKMKMLFESFDLDKKEEQKECTSYFDEQLSNIETYVQSLTSTIDDFRNFYKPNKEKKRVTINEPIEKSLSIIEATAKANGVEILTSFESQKVFAMHDSELMQVFLNIIKNAQDNFKEKDIKTPRIMIQSMDIASGVHIDICDNGGGISEDIQMRIFDPYFSTKNEKNGTGLGLYMTKTIVEEHHAGKIRVRNRNGGACFSITLFEK